MLFVIVLLVSTYWRFNDEDSFTFKTSSLKPVTVTNQSSSFIKKIYRRYIKSNERSWYFVHVPNNKDITTFLKANSNVHSSNMILTNTLLLYLSPSQVQSIVNFTLLKELEPEDKIHFESLSLEKTESLFISGCFNEPLKPESDYYTFHMISKESALVHFHQMGLSKSEFLKQKHNVVSLLSKMACIKYVSTYKQPTILNFLGAGFTQRSNSNLINGSYLERYVNDHGITGKGEVVTLLDSPVDPYHNQFYDPNVEFAINKILVGHSKIVYYKYEGTLDELHNQIEARKHGTHCAGTIAGNSICDSDKDSRFNGVAPNSKILYYGDFKLIDDGFIKRMIEFDSRISSNSWGTPVYSDYDLHQF